MPAKQGVTNEVHDTFSMAKAMIETMTGFYDDMHVDDPAVKARAIFVDTMNVRATDFDLDRDTQQKLYDKDRTAASSSSTAAMVKSPGTGISTWPSTARLPSRIPKSN